ncbi:MAG: ImmA/IrrE family metallo-endopeptidase, partial [Pseudomonadota bacterium]|nr:ImmA/IrrE family metallo-endopeptidase [Pseudomonadota bacterium]
MRIAPSVLYWALERGNHSIEELRSAFPELESWGKEQQPTLKELERFADEVSVPIGYLFLSKPPEEKLPIADFRRMRDDSAMRPSSNLLSTIYACQQRQNWYREHQLLSGEAQLDFIGSARLTTSPVKIAAAMRNKLGFAVEERGNMTKDAALKTFIERTSAAGVLVLINGVVGHNTRRKLDPQEFRGFALSDSVAPLIFINGADAKSAQMFTLAHELAHLWLGKTGLSDADMADGKGDSEHKVETWCNKVAAEFLVPSTQLEELAKSVGDAEIKRLVKYFKVSKLVILRRLYDIGKMSYAKFMNEYKKELASLQKISKTSGGGNFYATFNVRINEKFARALISSTLEGKTLYRECFRLLEIKNAQTFESLAKQYGIK